MKILESIVLIAKMLVRKAMSMWYWLPIILADEQWDFTYFFKLLDAKFRLLEKYYSSNNYNKKMTQKLRVCRLLCKRLTVEDYSSMLDLEIRSRDLKTTFAMLAVGKPVVVCHSLGYYGNRWVHYEDYMQKQDLDMLCNLIRKYAFTWWD